MRIKREDLLVYFQKYPNETLHKAFRTGEEDENITLSDGKLVMPPMLTAEMVINNKKTNFFDVWGSYLVRKRIKSISPKAVLSEDIKIEPENALELVELFQYINQFTNKKRILKYASDIKDRITSENAVTLLAAEGDEVNRENLRGIKKHCSEENLKLKLPLTIGESDILIYLSKNENGFSHQDTILNAVEGTGIPYQIARDKKSFAEAYKTKSFRLFVFGYQQDSVEEMSLYLFLKRSDPASLILEFDEVFLEKNAHRLEEIVSKTYANGYHDWALLSKQNKQKISIQEEDSLKSEIEDLSENYSRLMHTKITYKIEKLSEKCDTLILERMLSKVQK